MAKQSWSCATCGATTTDPEHRLIVYFHMNCPGNVTKVTPVELDPVSPNPYN